MKLYIYDHCPYCVKARMIFGLHDVPFELITLLNDDAETLTRMIGKKMVPVLQRDDGSYLPESMDIVHETDRQGGTPLLTGNVNPAISEWLQASRDYLYLLAMPRWVKMPLEEFATEGAKRFFTEKKEAMIGSFAENLAQSESLIAQANAHLKELAPMIRSGDAVNGTLSEDDIHLFATLRSLSAVRGIIYPDEVEAYRQNMATRSRIPLHDDMTIQAGP